MLLGILAATALPRFLDVTDQAKTASLEGISGGFSAGLTVVKAQWAADGNSSGTAGSVVNIDGGPIITNENGWPAEVTNSGNAASNAQTNAECLEVWNFILQNPPQATISGAGALTAKDKYRVTRQGNGGSNTCTYTFVNNATEDTTRQFVYFTETGQITVTVP